MSLMSATSLTEVTQRIDAHLKRMEADPVLNVKGRSGSRFFCAGAARAGRLVEITYVSYRGYTPMQQERADAYLAWLDAGNVGTHHLMLRPPEPTS